MFSFQVIVLDQVNFEFLLILSFSSTTKFHLEFHDLKDYMKRYKVHRYTPESFAHKARLKDGGIAIIDQIICSHAK
jgi:peptide-O-fucosyltransferase